MIKKGFTPRRSTVYYKQQKLTFTEMYRTKHCPNIFPHNSSLYHHNFTDEQTGAQKCSLMPAPALEIQLEPKTESLILKAVFFWAKEGLCLLYCF